jgi:glycogen operon protein
VHRFVKLLIARRLLRDLDAEIQRTSLNELLKNSNKAWHGVKLFQPDWNSWSHSLAFGAEISNQNITFHLIMNAYWQALDFELPPVGDAGPWRRWIDTFLAPPDDIVAWRTALPISGESYRAGPRSVVVLYR